MYHKVRHFSRDVKQKCKDLTKRGKLYFRSSVALMKDLIVIMRFLQFCKTVAPLVLRWAHVFLLFLIN